MLRGNLDFLLPFPVFLTSVIVGNLVPRHIASVIDGFSEKKKHVKYYLPV